LLLFSAAFLIVFQSFLLDSASYAEEEKAGDNEGEGGGRRRSATSAESKKSSHKMNGTMVVSQRVKREGRKGRV
jgi:hypothetical protein